MQPGVLLTIPTTRMEASVAFYREVLQFELKERMDRPNGVVLTFLVHPCGFVVEFVAGPHIPSGEVGPGAPLLTFTVPDLLDITTRLDLAGLPVPTPIALPGGLSMLRFPDPNGVTISFMAGEL